MDEGYLLTCRRTWSTPSSTSSTHKHACWKTTRNSGHRIDTEKINACRSHLNNLLIWHSRHEEILFVLVGVELDAVRDLPVGEVWDALACRDKKHPSGSSGHYSKFWFSRSRLKYGSHLSQSPRAWDSGHRQRWGTGYQCCWSKYLALLCCALKTRNVNTG